MDFQRDLPGQLFIGGGLAVPIPVWRRQQGELALARADRSRVVEERTLVERDVALEVERAYQAEAAQREMSQVLDREVLPAAEAAVTLMTEGWRAGKFDLFRLLQTSRDASEARRLYLETLDCYGNLRSRSIAQWGRHERIREIALSSGSRGGAGRRRARWRCGAVPPSGPASRPTPHRRRAQRRGPGR